jgi:hypothetical protein
MQAERRRQQAHLFDPEDIDSTILRNVGEFLLDYTSSYLRSYLYFAGSFH